MASALPVDDVVASEPRRGAQRWLGLIPAVLLLAVAGWELVATRRAATSVPDDVAWARASQIVRASYQPGDLIVFAPRWIDPVGRLHLGDLIPLEVAGRMDAARYGRIWELSIRGARAPETVGLVAVSTADADGVIVRHFQRAPATVVADVRERVRTAVSEHATPRVELTEVDYEPHRCILFVPRPGQPARMTFPRLPLGTELVGYVGIADATTRRDDRSSVQLAVEIAGKQVATTTAGVEDGWVRFAVPTVPGAADVTFVASAPRPGRQLCFAAETRR
ncbi:MAG: hypothetical protein WKG01_04670 [Kofleriaceae bacterium]